MPLRSLIARVPGAKFAYSSAARASRRIATALRRPPADAPLIAPPTAEEVADFRSLARQNRRSRKPIVDARTPAVVTMTSHGSRLRTVHYALESIARGTTLPSRIILWVDEPVTGAWSRRLRRLEARGLEVIRVEKGLRVHTKYYPYATSLPSHRLPLVTSDDDIMYPSSWLADLLAAYERHPGSIACFRAHTIVVENGSIAPYTSWRPCVTVEPSFATFGTSVSGQVFPPALLDIARDAGTAFADVAPNNDDIWLHHLAVAAGIRAAQVRPSPLLFPFVPGTQETGLFLSNYWDGGNDRQVQATYTAQDAERIAADS